jgi:hypothetical protein
MLRFQMALMILLIGCVAIMGCSDSAMTDLMGGMTDPDMTDPGMTDPGMTDPGDPGMTDPEGDDGQ